MFVAWRDLRHARGRFLLIGTVVALITVLVGFLAGLTGGLAAQNISAVLGLPGDRLVLEKPADGAASFSESSLSAATVERWREAEGVKAVVPVGITQARASVVPSSTASSSTGSSSTAPSSTGSSSTAPSSTAVALFGLPQADASAATDLTALAPGADDSVGLSSGAAKELNASAGDLVTILGADYRVASVGGDAWYSHTPVVALTPAAWARADERMGGDGRATVLAVTGVPDWDAVASATRTSAQPTLLSLTALETFKSEIGSLGLMVAMLFGISALVVGAFFTVWTMQRSADVAVLKALGATQRSLVLDALGQALVVLVGGIGIGMLAVLVLGALAGNALPFLLAPITTLVPAAAMTVLGLAGAAFALRTVTHADPLTALGSNR